MRNKSKRYQRDITMLSAKHLFTMTLWLVFCRYKVRVMKHYEDMGMLDLFAFRAAKKMSKKGCLELLEEHYGKGK